MKYLLNRLLWSIPTLLAVVVIGFVLLVNTPGDPVNTILHLSSDDDPLLSSNANVERQRKEWEEKLGLNLPLFYCSIESSVLPDTLYKISNKAERNTVRVLCLRTGQTDRVLEYRGLLKEFHLAFIQDVKLLPTNQRDSLRNRIDEITHTYNLLLYETNSIKINVLVSKLFGLTSSKHFLRSLNVAATMDKVVNFRTRQSIDIFSPKIQFHKRSRFHQWLFGDGIYSKGIIRGDFGISYVTREPINAHIYKSLFWSVLFSGIGILLAYLISIPIGIRSAIYNHTTGEKIVTVLLFALYSIPVFFLGTLLQTYLANHQYIYLFEPTGIQPVRGFAPGSNWLEKVWQTFPYIVLPIICYTYSSIAFLSRLTKTSVMETLNQPYITTAKAKGLPFKKVIYKHAFRNALIPLVTVFANVFPVLVGGSVLIETIFTIPGMGTEMFNAYFAHNVPVIISIFTLTGIFTVAGFFISDILYTLVDPRIRK
jgi:peptide/nickel transport system permease protein